MTEVLPMSELASRSRTDPTLPAASGGRVNYKIVRGTDQNSATNSYRFQGASSNNNNKNNSNSVFPFFAFYYDLERRPDRSL